ncbi:MAG: hypothetical protein WC942_10545 [Clostridia bacterium]|jgi:hypothetical protein
MLEIIFIKKEKGIGGICIVTDEVICTSDAESIKKKYIELSVETAQSLFNILEVILKKV